MRIGNCLPIYVHVCYIIYVCDALGLYEGFEDCWLEVSFVGASCDGTFCEVQVYVRPYYR